MFFDNPVPLNMRLRMQPRFFTSGLAFFVHLDLATLMTGASAKLKRARM